MVHSTHDHWRDKRVYGFFEKADGVRQRPARHTAKGILICFLVSMLFWSWVIGLVASLWF